MTPSELTQAVRLALHVVDHAINVVQGSDRMNDEWHRGLGVAVRLFTAQGLDTRRVLEEVEKTLTPAEEDDTLRVG